MKQKYPQGWDLLSLERICLNKEGLRRGPFGGTLKKEIFVDEGFQVYEQRNAIYDDFQSARYFVDKKKYDELKAFQIKANDLIVSCSGTIGKIAKVPINFKYGVINQALLRIRVDTKIIDEEYFLQQFRSTLFQNKIIDSTQGGAMRNLVGMKDFRKTLIPLPPLPEQQKIADILSTVDEKIAVIDQQITATEDLKKGLMQRLLTKGIGHTEFKDSPLGEIPKSWDVKSLKSIINVSSGQGLSKSMHIEGNFPVYGGNGIVFHHNNFTHKEPQLIIGRVGAKCGCVHITENNCWITDNALIVSSKIEVEKYFLYNLLYTINLNNYANKNAQPVISGSKIYPIKVLLPPISEQKEIAEILNKVESKLQTQKDKKQAYQQLKKGLMQQLLTGKIRINQLLEA